MRLLILWLALMAPSATLAQAASWSESGDRISISHAGISFPKSAGSVKLDEMVEFSRKGEGLDNAAQYRSPDRKVLATVYVYYPGLADSGLTSLATGKVIEGPTGQAKKTATRLAGAGGVADSAIRSSYSGYRGDMASTAAFLKAGRWIVKIRVSGPQDRQSEVEAAMDELLAQARFDKSPPEPANLLSPPSCSGEPLAQAAAIEEDMATVLEDAVVLGSTSLVPRTGANLCVVSPSGDAAPLAILRAIDSESSSASSPGQTIVIVLLNDSGSMLEVVQAGGNDGSKKPRYRVLHHLIGRTVLLGTFAAIPSDAQIYDLTQGKAAPVGRVKATVNLKADGDTDIEIVAPPAAPASPTT